MKRLAIHILLAICVLLVAERAHAQYYSWGVDPTSYRWRQMKSEKYRVIYPDTAQIVGEKMMHYLDAVSNDISFGYKYPQMSIPFVVHPANMLSNGLVMWLPKRVEFLSTPEADGYSMPWIKQLIAHEYRHAVQYNNLNRGLIKALSYVIGQQSSTIGLLFMPLWMMEGDAVMTETAMSTFGRGMQPSFSLTYRSYGNIADEFRNIDKWFCGSYKEYIPDHYTLGYMMCRHGYNSFGRVMGNDIAELSVRRPYMVVSTSWMLKRLYGSSIPRLFDDTFRTLATHWDEFDDVEQTTQPLAIPAIKSHTRYDYPIALDDGFIALKSDLDTPSAFVFTDSLGNQERIIYTGMVSSRPMLSDTRRLWWTEYRRSLLFAEKVGSKVRYMDLSTGRTRTIRQSKNALYATPMESRGIAWVEYSLDGSYSIISTAEGSAKRIATLPTDKEVHGMAWDNSTEALYLLITDDRGMHIARLTDEGLEQITEPAYTTLSNLRAADGVLYFGSIASGRDELHSYDLTRGREYRLSTSKYGSFMPSPKDSTTLIATSYSREGYLPVVQSTEGAVEQPYAPHPPKILLPEIKEWDVVNLDTVRFDSAIKDSIVSRTPPRRFKRFAHAFNIHSWAPASYDPYELVEESRISFNLGATILSQNILSTMEGFLTWGWNRDEGSVFKGMIRYNGLGVNLWVKGTYGGTQNIHTVYRWDAEKSELVFPEAPKRGKYYAIGAGATLPLMFQHGYHTSQLSLTASWDFSNGMVANVDRLIFDGGKIQNFETIGYTEGVHLLQTGITYQNTVRQAHRDFLPSWGVVASVSYALNPTTNDFGHLAVAYAKLYTPGFAKHHSLSLAASYQTSLGGFYSPTVRSGLAFKSTRLLPRGFSSYDIENDNYVATSLNYQLPLWYPDGGWRGVIYFKRLRLNIGGDYASFRRMCAVDSQGAIKYRREHIWSYGGDITADLNLFGMPQAATIAATLSLYYKQSPYNPKTDGKMYVSFGIGLPF